MYRNRVWDGDYIIKETTLFNKTVRLLSGDLKHSTAGSLQIK
jgi:hypothetical protein